MSTRRRPPLVKSTNAPHGGVWHGPTDDQPKLTNSPGPPSVPTASASAARSGDIEVSRSVPPSATALVSSEYAASEPEPRFPQPATWQTTTATNPKRTFRIRGGGC